ncbi:hypothetical protein D3C87_2154940 [compost metagenome]
MTSVELEPVVTHEQFNKAEAGPLASDRREFFLDVSLRQNGVAQAAKNRIYVRLSEADIKTNDHT